MPELLTQGFVSAGAPSNTENNTEIVFNGISVYHSFLWGELGVRALTTDTPIAAKIGLKAFGAVPAIFFDTLFAYDKSKNQLEATITG